MFLLQRLALYNNYYTVKATIWAREIDVAKQYRLKSTKVNVLVEIIYIEKNNKTLEIEEVIIQSIFL